MSASLMDEIETCTDDDQRIGEARVQIPVGDGQIDLKEYENRDRKRQRPSESDGDIVRLSPFNKGEVFWLVDRSVAPPMASTTAKDIKPTVTAERKAASGGMTTAPRLAHAPTTKANRQRRR